MAWNRSELPNLQQINRFETPFKWVMPTLQMTSKIEGQVVTFEFGITNPYPSNYLQTWRSSCNFRIWNHNSVPFTWPPKLKAKLQLINLGSQLPTLQMTSKIEGQVATFEFGITTPYPSNDLQNWRSSCNFGIWDHHSLPFKCLQNQVAIFEFDITAPYPSNDLQNWRTSCNFEISDQYYLPFKWLPKMTSKFRDQTPEKLQL